MQLAAFGGAKLGLNILDVGGEAMELPATLYVSAMVVCKILPRGFPLGNWKLVGHQGGALVSRLAL